MNDLSPVLLIFVIIVGVWLLNSIKILREYERGVIFRLGRILSEPKGPGLVFVFAPVDRMVRISLRIDTPMPAGRSHARRHREGERGDYFDRSAAGRNRSVELSPHGLRRADYAGSAQEVDLDGCWTCGST
jgi:hypothetical protein